MPMKNPPHPGLSVRHDCLQPLGLNVTEAAKWLGVSRKQLSDIVNCHAGISPEMAIRLDKTFGGGADTWLRVQAAYDLAQAMQHVDEIKVKRLSPAADPWNCQAVALTRLSPKRLVSASKTLSGYCASAPAATPGETSVTM